ncbi:hypothetical protein KR038_009712, partial [Drosophila bunnanda]
FFLPHHCVHKQESTSTKLPVVFDGSGKLTPGRCLNDLFLAEPTIPKKIFNILLRFRFFKVTPCGDICKIYRYLRVSHPDNFLQFIAWRENSTDELSEGHFPIRKCCSNDAGALQGKSDFDREQF